MHLLANRLSFFFGIKIHFLFAAELPICSRNTETLKTVSRCIVPGRFWAFSFDMSGFILAAVSFTANHPKATVCHFRIKKSAVLLRRFCLARKMEQGNAIQLSVVLFLSADNHCSKGCAAAGKQQENPQCKVAGIAGLRRFRIVL